LKSLNLRPDARAEQLGVLVLAALQHMLDSADGPARGALAGTR
jgi:hypothetical protein